MDGPVAQSLEARAFAEREQSRRLFDVSFVFDERRIGVMKKQTIFLHVELPSLEGVIDAICHEPVNSFKSGRKL